MEDEMRRSNVTTEQCYVHKFWCEQSQYLKALANKDTLLRTHRCSWSFLGCANWATLVADTKCFWTKSKTFLCPGHKVCVRNKCCSHSQTGKHLCRQQCVRYNVSSLAKAFTCTYISRCEFDSVMRVSGLQKLNVTEFIDFSVLFYHVN